MWPEQSAGRIGAKSRSEFFAGTKVSFQKKIALNLKR